MAKAFDKFFRDELEGKVTDAARQVTVNIMNDLAQKGPAYSGEFSSAWYAVRENEEAGGPRGTGKIYKYDLRNVPKTRFKPQGRYYEIVNGSEHALIAMDLEEGIFVGQYEITGYDEDGKEIRQKIPPVGRVVDVGARPSGPHLRGNLGDSGDSPYAISTAPLDWYNTYTSGGGMKIALARGVRLGFREGPLSGQPGQGFSE